MNPEQILIITAKLDPHADVVVTELESLGQKIFRLNTDDFLTEYLVNLESVDSATDTSIRLTDNLGRTVVIPDNIKAVYYRKPKPMNTPISLRDGAAQFAVEEANEALRSINSFSELRWINHPFVIRSAQMKFPQMRLAKRVGLSTPRTLVTNNPDDARRFFHQCNEQVVCKSLVATAIKYEDNYFHTYTHRLSQDEFESHVDSVRYTPTLFQEYVPKQVELRITIFGRNLFACEIDSQGCTESSVDWRAVDPFTIPHRACEIPANLAAAIRRYMELSSLSFSAMDFILTPTGDYYFLENNPNGQWYWIEMITKQPMARAMAALLSNGDR